MKVERVTTAMLGDIKIGRTAVFELPNRAAYESAKANIYRWGKIQDPPRLFSCKISDTSTLLVTRKS